MANRWNRFAHLPNKPLYPDGSRATASAAHLALSEEAAAEGIVLLKNDGLLPLNRGTRVALFGKATWDYVKGGGGSGDTTVSHVTNLYEGLKELAGEVFISESTISFYREHVEKELSEGTAPGCVSEPALTRGIVKQAAYEADVAIISISRFSGEAWDRKLDKSVKSGYSEFTKGEHQSAKLFERGDFYLSEAEAAMVDQVKRSFHKVAVLLNVGGVIETGWFAEDKKIQAAMLIGQGGMRGGAAAARAIMGHVNPSGKLTDTWAKDIADYPSTEGFFKSDDFVEYEDDIYIGYRYFQTIPGAGERIAYPFGFGLSYSEFSIEAPVAKKNGKRVEAEVTVVNRGSLAGKEVVQLYFKAPQGKLGKPERVLAAFAKTRLLQPGDVQRVVLTVGIDELASFDDEGLVKKSAWVLEKGDYEFFLGTDAVSAKSLGVVFDEPKDRAVKQLESHLAPTALKRRLRPDGSYEKLKVSKAAAKKEKEKLKKFDLREQAGLFPGARAQEPKDVTLPEKVRYPFKEVAEGKLSLTAFMKLMTDEDLCWMFGGQPNTGVANTCGLGNIERLAIPNVMTADGPAGLRIEPDREVTTTAWPVATTLASSWDPELLSRVGEAAAEEVKENNIGVWLAPALNIHRSPLCGRNFEYFSEDPLVAGTMAAAIVRGVQSQHIAATVKHFAFNNKESNRYESDSIVSERAAREIYLKAFEIVVTQAEPWCVMTSYNLVNGVHTSESRELITDILRGEWGYDGLVMTDWWSTGDPYKDLLAGIDLRMPNGVPSRIEAALKAGAIERGDLERAAKHILELILKLD